MIWPRVLLTKIFSFELLCPNHRQLQSYWHWSSAFWLFDHTAEWCWLGQELFGKVPVSVKLLLPTELLQWCHKLDVRFDKFNAKISRIYTSYIPNIYLDLTPKFSVTETWSPIPYNKPTNRQTLNNVLFGAKCHTQVSKVKNANSFFIMYIF